MNLYDPIRQKDVSATPEEAVRQQTLHFLTEKLNVPAHLIAIEFPLCHIKKSSRDRVDILVHDFRESHSISKPWLLVECKAPGEYTWMKLEVQLNRYLKILTPSFLMLALGDTVRFFEWNIEAGRFFQRKELPEYPQINNL